MHVMFLSGNPDQPSLLGQDGRKWDARGGTDLKGVARSANLVFSLAD
jgi:hypothetical protein